MNHFRVKPGTRVELDKLDPDAAKKLSAEKEEAKAEVERLNRRLEELQELLFAEGRHRVLIVLQGMDTAGKDSVIRQVFEGVNPQGVKVAAFKVPTPIELAHDFLWRVHPHAPGNGEMVIFNRSHYEDVLVVRVHELAPKAVWQGRYDQINAFEKLLAEAGTTILKFFLHISREEQRRRLQERLDDPKKRWKFRAGDLAEREHWSDYATAYEEAISRTSTNWAPWFVVPSNHKWYRNLLVSRAIVEALEGLDMHYPPVEAGVEGLVVE